MFVVPLLLFLVGTGYGFVQSPTGNVLAKKGLRIPEPPSHRYAYLNNVDTTYRWDVPNKEYVDALGASSTCCPTGPMAIDPDTSVFVCDHLVLFDGMLFVHNGTLVRCNLFLGAVSAMDFQHIEQIAHSVRVVVDGNAQVVDVSANSTTWAIDFLLLPEKGASTFEVGVFAYGRAIQGRGAGFHAVTSETLLFGVVNSLHLTQDKQGLWSFDFGESLESCQAYYDYGARENGKYLVQSSVAVCDQENQGGGWMVVYNLPYTPPSTDDLVISNIDIIDTEGGWSKENEMWRMSFSRWSTFTNMRLWCATSGASEGDQYVVIDDTKRAALAGCADVSCNVDVGLAYLSDSNSLWTDDGNSVYHFFQDPPEVYFSRLTIQYCHFNIYPSSSVCECNNALSNVNDGSGKKYQVLVR